MTCFFRMVDEVASRFLSRRYATGAHTSKIHRRTSLKRTAHGCAPPMQASYRRQHEILAKGTSAIERKTPHRYADSLTISRALPTEGTRPLRATAFPISAGGSRSGFDAEECIAQSSKQVDHRSCGAQAGRIAALISSFPIPGAGGDGFSVAHFTSRIPLELIGNKPHRDKTQRVRNELTQYIGTIGSK